ncbi:MAG: GrdX family protein [Treponema sp.]|uniref:GrdX family protein n=1 Tax=Treponema sp. TaxID=166 RepID=UPI003FA1FF69
MKLVVITNNPKTAEYIRSQYPQQESAGETVSPILLVFCETRDEVYMQVRDYIHRNWKLQNHAMYGNIQLHKQPYRSMVLCEGTQLDSASLLLWEQAMERVKRGCIPDYSEQVLQDFQALDFSLFSSIIYPSN